MRKPPSTNGTAPDRMVQAYRSASAHWRQATTLATACFDGLWLGLMDRSKLAHLDEDFYANGTDVHDGTRFSYTDEVHNLAGLQPWELAAIRRHFPPSGRVVVTGAGGGREVAALRELGYDAIGYEPNPALVRAGAELLRRHGHGDVLLACDRDAFPSDPGPCDALVVGWGSYMLIPGRARRVEFLRAARRTLSDGAPLLCSFFLRAPGVRYFTVVAGTASAVRRLRNSDPAEVGDTVGHNYQHYFTRAEIEQELADAGFELIHFAPTPYAHAVARATGRVRGRPAPAARAAAPPGAPLLELRGITKAWPGMERPVLDHADLSVPRGAVTLLGGRNGIGKTTLLRIAVGLIGPDSGAVRLDGLDPIADRRAFQARVAFLSAGTGGLYARLSVEWHLDWWGRLGFLTRSQRRQAAAAAIARFDLDELRTRRVDRLSMGQRQRVRLAGTFLRDPDVVVLDEPRNSLDAPAVDRLLAAVAQTRDRGGAVLWAAPTDEGTQFDFDRRLVLEHGKPRPQ
jgi:ABC-type multidrug transport system ATPase subunit